MSVDVIAALVKRIEDMERRFSNGERHGKITEVDKDSNSVKISDGIWSSGWIPWREHNSKGGLKTRSLPTVGSAGVVRGHSGGLESGFASYSAYPTDEIKLPTSDNGKYDGEHIWSFGDDDPKSSTQGKRPPGQESSSGSSSSSSDSNSSSKPKRVWGIYDSKGNKKHGASDSDTKNVGDFTHIMTKDGGHVLTTGGTQPTELGQPVQNPDFTYTQTKDGHVMTNRAGHKYTLDANGHKIEAGDFKYTLDPSGGHKISAGDHEINLTSAGLLINAPAAFAQDYGKGSAPGVITKIDNAIDMV